MGSTDTTVTMEPNDQCSATSDSAKNEGGNGRTPLKQFSMSRPITSPPSTPLRRRRKRIGGKRTVRSCTSCRAAHVRCVADRYGVPCERCAKKSWLDVSSPPCNTHVNHGYNWKSSKKLPWVCWVFNAHADSEISAPSCRNNKSKPRPRTNLPTNPMS